MGLTAAKAVRRHSESFTQRKNNQELQIPSYHRQVKTFPWSQSSKRKLAKMKVTEGGGAAAEWRAGKPLARRCRHLAHGLSYPSGGPALSHSLKQAGSHAGLLPLCWPGAAGSSPPVFDLQPAAQENQRRSHTCRVSICSALGAELHPPWKGLLPHSFH